MPVMLTICQLNCNYFVNSMKTYSMYDQRMARELWNVKAKRLLRVAGITMQSVADRLHITKGAVSLKLNGKRETSLDEIREIARMIGITFTELVEHDPRVATSNDEKEVIDLFRSMGKHDKERMLLMMKALTPPKD